MENFNQLKDIIKTFHIGIVYYENQSYWVRRNPITHGLFYLDEINDLIKQPIQDLLRETPEIAAKEIKNLRNLIAVIAKYKEEVKNNRDALRQFEVNCEHYRVKVTKEYSAIEHFKGSLEGAGSFIVTSYFLNDLDYEISVRAAIVDRLEIGLKQEIKGIEPENLSIYQPSKWATRNCGVRVPGEMKWKAWAKILEADTYVPNEQKNDNTKQLDATNNTVKSIGQNIIPSPVHTGFESYLKEVSIIDKLLIGYNAENKAKSFALMVVALDRLDHLNINAFDIGQSKLKKALNTTFGFAGTEQGIGAAIRKYKDDSTDYCKNEIDGAKDYVSKLLATA